MPATQASGGHGQDGCIAQIVAGRDPELVFCLINSGPGVGVEEQDLYGVEHTLRHDGTSDAGVRRARAYMDRIHASTRAAMPYDAFVREVMEPVRDTPGFDYFGEVDAEKWDFLVRNFARPYDPVASLERITCPVLAIFGEADLLVPVAASVAIHQSALAKAGNRNVTIRLFPGADHRIRAGDPNGFAGGYLDTMVIWLHDRVR